MKLIDSPPEIYRKPVYAFLKLSKRHTVQNPIASLCWAAAFICCRLLVEAAEPDFSFRNYLQYNDQCRLAECRDYVGIVNAIKVDDGGTLIRFQAESITEYRGQKNSKEKPPHPGAKVTVQGGSDSGPDIWYWTQNASEIAIFRWRKGDGFVPVAPGMRCSITVDHDDNVVEISYEAAITHWRKRQNGFLEVVLAAEAAIKTDVTKLIYVQPARMGADACAMDIHWTKKWGLLITVDGAGPGEIEPEAPRTPNVSFTVANTSELTIVPGRDGWHSLPSLKHYSSEAGAKDLKSEDVAKKMWKQIRDAIPKGQYMRMAG